MKLYGGVLSFITGLCIHASVANATPTDFEGWFTTSALVSLDESKTHQLYLELQPRIADDWQRAGLLLIRPAVVYNATSDLSLYVGYAWQPTFLDANYHRTYRDEQRLWQQILYKHELWGIAWQHRLRQEQRKIEHTNGVSNRTRYLLRGSYPLTDAHDMGIAAFQEILVTLNNTENGPWDGYDRSRFFLGPYWIVDNARYDVGYLGEHAKRFGDDERWVNAIAASVALNF